MEKVKIFSLSNPDENKDYFLALQRMIEEMAHKAGGPVVLIAHSMGNMYTLYFLNQQPQAWKDRYIKAFISLGAPWGGVAKTLRVLASGERRKPSSSHFVGPTDHRGSRIMKTMKKLSLYAHKLKMPHWTY